jgi:regulatory protein
MGVITLLEVQKRNKERVNVYLDDAYAFSVTLIDAVRLKKGQTLTPNDIAALKTEDELTRAVERAARFLSYRPRSTAEVRRNLAEKSVDESVIAAAIERLETMGYLDDVAFARFWVQNRVMFKPLGTRALRYELRQKGISDPIIAQVLAEVDADDNAYRAAHKHASRLRVQDRAEFRAKMSSFLQRRGFDYATSSEVIDRLLEGEIGERLDGADDDSDGGEA